MSTATDLLIDAIKANSATEVEHLLKAGADVNAKDDYGLTPLMLSNSSEIVSLLLAAGADVNAENIYGVTTLMLSKTGEMTSLLLEAGANINARTDAGHTALMLSETSEKTALLLAASAGTRRDYVNARTYTGFTALMYSGPSETTSLLLEAGAEVDARDISGATALTFAINIEDKKKVQCLLAHGADANAKNEWGDNMILDEILYTRSPSLAALVLAAGAKPEKEDRVIQQWLESRRQGKREKIALLLAAGARHWLNPPTELKPTPQDLAEADDRLRDARAELAAERSRVSLRAIRGRAVQVCIALQGLDLPALITLHILEELDEKARSVRMGALWALIVAVKHSRPEA